MSEIKAAPTPFDMLAKQANLLETIAAHEGTVAKENQNISDLLREILDEQMEQTQRLNSIARAANLYFWLTVLMITGTIILLVVRIGVFVSLLRLFRLI
jgi:CHASE3 domain sensor protein